MKIPRLISLAAVLSLMLACNMPALGPQSLEPGPQATQTGAVAPAVSETPTVAVPATDTPVPVPTDTATVTPTSTPSVPMVTPVKDPVNCRYGPGVVYAPLGAGLAVGSSAQIIGKTSDGSAWQVQNPDKSGGLCWVAASVVTATGDLSAIPVVAPPAGFVTNVTASVSPTTIQVPGCVFPVGYSWNGVITVNGPVTVKWHWELSQGNIVGPTESLVFTAFGSHSLGDSYHIGSAGDSTVKLVVTSPNSLLGIAKFKVVCT